ncbi:5060_t:CDS:2 [Ambispora leptoticha]|uniref:5060_t:CDS:1 n=1 Tax=Ambispora leptoticha TaxID=144679 RepID=A0A9N9BWC8_9GLOM|nr:5060_t:CDS:2 [Ambispora leptoticha]
MFSINELRHEFLRDIASIYDKQTNNYDVKIIVSSTKDEKIFNAHSVILCARSSYFNAAILNEETEKEENKYVLRNSDIQPSIFECILKFLYTGEIDLQKEIRNNVIDYLSSLATAEKLRLDSLLDYIQLYLLNNDQTYIQENLIKILNVARQHTSYTKLRSYCESIYRENPQAIFDAGDFTLLSDINFTTLLKRNDLNLPEIKIWERLIDWGKANHSELQSDVSVWSEGNFELLEKAIGPLLKHIRFFLLSSSDYYTNVRPYKKILSTKLRQELKGFYYMEGNKLPANSLGLRNHSNNQDQNLFDIWNVQLIESDNLQLSGQAVPMATSQQSPPQTLSFLPSYLPKDTQDQFQPPSYAPQELSQNKFHVPSWINLNQPCIPPTVRLNEYKDPIPTVSMPSLHNKLDISRKSSWTTEKDVTMNDLLHKKTCTEIYSQFYDYFRRDIFPPRCHPGIHAAVGDLSGFNWHLNNDSKVFKGSLFFLEFGDYSKIVQIQKNQKPQKFAHMELYEIILTYTPFEKKIAFLNSLYNYGNGISVQDSSETTPFHSLVLHNFYFHQNSSSVSLCSQNSGSSSHLNGIPDEIRINPEDIEAVVKWLIGKGFPINALNRTGHSALGLAIRLENGSVLNKQFLKISPRNKQWSHDLILAMVTNGASIYSDTDFNEESKSIYIKKKAPAYPNHLWPAVKYGLDIGILRAMITNIEDVQKEWSEQEGGKKCDLLKFSAKYDHLDMVMYLLENFIEFHSTDTIVRAIKKTPLGKTREYMDTWIGKSGEEKRKNFHLKLLESHS